MRRGRTLILVVLILIIGLAAVGYVLTQLSQPAVEVPIDIEVFAAGQNIPQGVEITEAMLKTVKIPQANIISSYYTKEEISLLVPNKVALFPLSQDALITEAMVSEKSSAVSIAGPQWASIVPPGMTAMAIPITRLSLAGYGVNDGAHVNVVGCFLFVDVDPGFQSALPNGFTALVAPGLSADVQPVLTTGPGGVAGRVELDPSLQQPFYYTPGEPQRARTVCQIMLQDVVVMKLGNFSRQTVEQQQANANNGDPATQGQPAEPSPDLVTLLVSPQDSLMLTYMVYTNAQIHLTLRNASDQSRQVTEAATLQFLLSQYNIPVPARLPYSLHPQVNILQQPFLPNDVVQVEGN